MFHIVSEAVASSSENRSLAAEDIVSQAVASSSENRILSALLLPAADKAPATFENSLEEEIAKYEKGEAAFMSEYFVNRCKGEPPQFKTFLGAIEIQKTTSRGRGIFASRDFSPREVLIAERSIGGVHAPGDATIAANVRKACTDSKYALGMLQMLRGGTVPCMKMIRECNFALKPLLVLDIQEVVKTNTRRGTNLEFKDGRARWVQFMGLWPMIALVNHSCDYNSAIRLMGDTLFLTAVREIKKGEEVVVTRCEPCVPVENRHRLLGFQCECKYCKLEQSLSDMKTTRRLFMKACDDYLEHQSKKSLKDIEKFVLGVEKKQIPEESKAWIRSTFWRAYRLGASPRLIGLDTAIETHLQCTPGKASVLLDLAKIFKPTSGDGISHSKYAKLLEACRLCYPGVNVDAAAEMMLMLTQDD